MYKYRSESKVLQYFGNVGHNSAALYAFTDVVKMMKYTGVGDVKIDLIWLDFMA